CSEGTLPALAEKLDSSPNPESLWTKTLDAIRQDGKQYALTWLEKLQPLGVRAEGENTALVLGVADRFFRDWVDDHYRVLLEETVARLGQGPTKVLFEVRTPPP